MEEKNKAPDEAENIESTKEAASPESGGPEAPPASGEKLTEKKPTKKKSRADKQKERLDELEDRVKRQMAEFENFRKRTEKEKTQMFETGARSVIEKILPIVDNFERGLAAVTEEEGGSSFAEGMNLIYKQLVGELEKLEVKPIPAVGCEFDPALHNAVTQVASDEYESGVVAQEMQKGYTYRDTVIRHSLVGVSE